MYFLRGRTMVAKDYELAEWGATLKTCHNHLPVASKVLTLGGAKRGWRKKAVDSKRMTPATQVDVHESNSQRRDVAASAAEVCRARAVRPHAHD